ncbi:tetratricopeptide repeat protein [Aquibium sp. A9E412]|uniref:tetratricopeptide repeat protein n=1 Tax=Aquibium sp. A9E412 TaxID=2976767 RepID=UPI0025AFCBDD|nr:tetratricopeptide repeat protein [Aquibium sp. A9E412]MDN2565183.1 tetratricopeptide repeat protein [Aquibium sp. A9E412]
MQDDLGNPLSGAGADGAAHYRRAVADLQRFVGDPVAAVDAAIAADPGFVMAHVFKGYLFGLSTEAGAAPVVEACHRAAAALPACAQERAHVAALGHLAAGRWHEAGQVLEDLTIDHPRDAVALQAGHQIDFFTGNARMLRDRIARALPAWDTAMPGHHAVLGMHAFGLEETGDYARAEAAGRRAVALEPRDGWAQHAVAHVMEMQCRQRDGIAWMRANPDNWTRDSFFQVHNWWHLALFHYELGEIDAVLALYDGPIYGAQSTVALNMVDAAALLWRLHLGGVDVGDRWQALARNWAPHAAAGNYAFNDMHAMMAFVGAGREDLARRLLEAQAEALAGDADNARFTRDVGQPLARAIHAFGAGDYRTAVRLIRPVRPLAHRFGGSHAQRDVIDLTLIEAALRGGQARLAAALAAERFDARPQSPLSALFARRAGTLAPVA